MSPLIQAFRQINLLGAAILLIAGCGRNEGDLTPDGRVIVSLWTSWAGIERRGIDEVIDVYNASQARFFVKSLNITDPRTKIMMATAGGNPPDLAIIGSQFIPAYAENNALTPLGPFFEASNLGQKDFLETFWKSCEHRGSIWAVPLTCSVTALHYNKKLFKEVGLDPARPPETLEALEEMNNRIALEAASGQLLRLGHLPLEPGWWRPEWSNWLGGSGYDGEHSMLFESEPWRQTGHWLASYSERFGSDSLIKLRSGFGRFSSPQNAFFTGKVAMILQGIWMNNFIETLAGEDFSYGVAPFPSSEQSGYPYYAVAEADCLIIPKGADRLRGAFDFTKFMASQTAMEHLALSHGKMTSLREVSPEFLKNHPHPYLDVFLEIARSGNAKSQPKLAHYMKYYSEAILAINEITHGLALPEDSLRQLQQTQQKELESRMRRWKRVETARLEEWDETKTRLSELLATDATL